MSDSGGNKTGLPIASLRIGDRVIARCYDGSLAAEYALFEAQEVVLHAAGPTGVVEKGYLTTAGDALERLAAAGASVALASEAALAFDHDVAMTYARGAAVRATIAHLRAYELFEGGTYSSATQLYDGAWLDLRAVASAMRARGAAAALQALHLADALDEVPRDAPVMLSTWTSVTEPRPGARTYRRVALDDIALVPLAIAALPPRSPPQLDAVMEHAVRDGLLRSIRARAMSEVPASVRTHLERLDALIGSDAPRSGPLAHPELWAIQKQLVQGDVTGVERRLDALELQLGKGAGIRYLRARAQLVRGDVPPRRIAERLAQIAEDEASFYEADVLAARAWLAAGEDAHARYFARRVADDAEAPEGIRLLSIEILESTKLTNQSHAPPPAIPRDAGRAAAPVALPGASRPPFANASEGVTFEPGALRPPRTVRMPAVTPAPAVPRAASPHAPVPPVTTGTTTPNSHHESELAETLAFPAGIDPSALRVTTAPSTFAEARVLATRLARDLGRDYRLWYGTTLRTDVMAIDEMQRHLRMRFTDGSALSDPRVVADLHRHGALLSEIIARNLGGAWADVSPREPGYWEMVVPPGTRTWPIGRVLRFVAFGHREQDLVSFYFELEDHSRRHG